MRKLKYFIEAILTLFFINLFKLLPFKSASDIGAKIACFIGPKTHLDKIARKNLDIVFPEMPLFKKNELIKLMWDNLGRFAAELPQINSLDYNLFLKDVDIIGLENFAKAKSYGKRVIFFSGHLGNWEALPRIIVENGFEIAVVYRAANNKFVDKIIQKERSKANVSLIAKGLQGGRLIVEELKNNRSVAMLIDQKMNDGVNVPFFGLDAMTAGAIAKLAQKYNCILVPIYCHRILGSKLKVVVEEPIEIIPSESTYNIMLNINQRLENWIRLSPFNWFWIHKRWPKDHYIDIFTNRQNKK